MTTTATRKSHYVRINLLGGFSVIADGEPCAVAEGSQRLLVYLALRERPQARAAMAASLWPDKADERAYANLRSCLWRLPTPGGVPLVRAEHASLQLSEHLDVDVKLAEIAGWALIRDPTGAIDDIDAALFFLELLPGCYDDWVVFERERFAQLQFHFLEALTDALVEHHCLAQALDIALRLVRADPLREGSQRALLSVYLAERNIGQARRQLTGYRRLINDTFGCDPSPGLIALAKQDR